MFLFLFFPFQSDERPSDLILLADKFLKGMLDTRTSQTSLFRATVPGEINSFDGKKLSQLK